MPRWKIMNLDRYIAFLGLLAALALAPSCRDASEAPIVTAVPTLAPVGSYDGPIPGDGAGNTGEEAPTTSSEEDEKAGYDLYAEGNFGAAEEKLIAALEKTSLVTGDRARIARIAAKLGDVKMQQAQPKDAEPYFQRALDMMVQDGATSGVEFATTKNSLAFALYKMSRWPEAETIYKDAIKAWDSCGTTTLARAQTLNNLGGLYKAQDRFAEAEAYYLQSLEMKKVLIARDATTIGASHYNLAQLYDAWGRNEDAARRYNVALAVWSLNPEVHANHIAQTRIGYATTLRKLKRDKDALRIEAGDPPESFDDYWPEEANSGKPPQPPVMHQIVEKAPPAPPAP